MSDIKCTASASGIEGKLGITERENLHPFDVGRRTNTSMGSITRLSTFDKVDIKNLPSAFKKIFLQLLCTFCLR